MSDQANQPLDPVKEEKDAIAMIARSDPGKLLHRYLRRVLETVFDFEDPGALQRHTGRRTLARDLMALMADGIEATSGGRESTRGDEPLLAGGQRAVDVRSGRRGAGRRIAGPVPGFDDDPAD